jgi:hypothetical protein
MKQNPMMKTAVAFLTVAVSLASAQTNEPVSSPPLEFRTNPPPALNRVSAAYRMGFNISAKFEGLGGFQALSSPGNATGHRQYRRYDDGYVEPDSRAPGIDTYTWNWGFDSASQVQPGAGTPYGYLLLHSSSASATASSTAEDGVQNGFEVTYDRQLGQSKHLRWGLEGAFNFMSASFRDDGAIAGTASRLTDTYALDGLNPFMSPPAPPNTPYRGTYEGGGSIDYVVGGPLINDYPISRQLQAVPGGSIITGRRTLDASVYGIRLGPYLEAPLGDHLTVGLSAGLSLVNVDSDFQYTESVTITGVGTSAFRSGGNSQSELMVGGYVSATVSYAISKSVGVFTSVQFQDVGLFTQSVGAKSAELDLSASIFVALGVSVSF